MIVDHIENRHLYFALGARIKAALEYLAATDFTCLDAGHYAVQNDTIFAIVNDYKTKDVKECIPETHQKFIDVQYMVNGVELFGYAPLTDQLPVNSYNETDDFTEYEADLSYVRLLPGMFIIFYPTDVHQPEVFDGEAAWVKKVVVKVKQSEL